MKEEIEKLSDRLKKNLKEETNDKDIDAYADLRAIDALDRVLLNKSPPKEDIEKIMENHKKTRYEIAKYVYPEIWELENCRDLTGKMIVEASEVKRIKPEQEEDYLTESSFINASEYPQNIKILKYEIGYSIEHKARILCNWKQEKE